MYLDLKPALKNPGARAARGTRRHGGGRRSAGERESVALRRRRRGEATGRALERREGPGGAPEAVDRRASARTERCTGDGEDGEGGGPAARRGVLERC